MTKAKAPARPAAPPLDSVTVSMEVQAPARRIFEVLSDPKQLPRWADPIKAIRREDGKDVVDYQLPDRQVACPCDSRLDAEKGLADWTVHIPGATALRVYTRVVPLSDERSVFVLTLVSPPFGPMRVKNARAIMEKNLAKDLERLKDLF